MKATIDIADHIFIRSKELAHQEHMALKELVEQGLECMLEAKDKKSSDSIKPVTFKGKGLSPQFRGASWDSIRQAAYEGRGT